MKARSHPMLGLLPAMILLAAEACFAQGSYPEDGWWWDADAPGRGYLVERQRDQVFIASFHYRDDGQPEWLSASGTYTPGDEDGLIGTFSGDVFRSQDGQCLGCGWQEPVTTLSAQGPLTIEFSDNRTGTLYWDSEAVPIKRFMWAWSDVLEQLAGDWLLTLVEDGQQQSQLVHIAQASDGIADIRNSVSQAIVGRVEWSGGDPMLVIEQGGGSELPLLIPESKRFYAGFTSDEELQAVAVRLDDMPFVIMNGSGDSAQSALEQFTPNVSLSVNGETLIINTDGLPNHPSAYWGEGHELYEAPHEGMRVNPNLIEEQDLTFRIPAQPQVAAEPTDTGLGPIGVSVNGVVFFNQYAGINMTTGEFEPLDNEIESFDFYNGHPQQQGQYHYHLEPLYLTVEDNAAFLGFALDGFPVYGPRNADGSQPVLDECNGETHATPEYPEGIYHYHITQVEPYILGCFRGTPGSFSR